MNKLQMPSSYAALTAEEQQNVCGGGEFRDSVNNFFENLRLDDFFYGGGFISFSVSFVPLLLFRMVKLGVQTGVALYNGVTGFIQRILRSTSSALGDLRNSSQSSAPETAQQQTNSLIISSFPGLLK